RRRERRPPRPASRGRGGRARPGRAHAGPARHHPRAAEARLLRVRRHHGGCAASPVRARGHRAPGARRLRASLRAVPEAMTEDAPLARTIPALVLAAGERFAGRHAIEDGAVTLTFRELAAAGLRAAR